ncbi:FAD/NAD(P)-binding domain-containing protein [Ustulina deusta]|nr:FAD/NAD(P)-binding domain-containing protein [Ustulina deusta]KAI3341802.1 FAD/NAD(P)-binding domain-containing protein [Ustulina deusta]
MDPTREDAIHNERYVKVICVGAGASGICLAYKLQRSFRCFSLTIYDKNPCIGGTWYENRYPGCACDVPSHNYVYSFEPKADFLSVYASSGEIQSYFEGFVQKYDLSRFLRLSCLVKETSWNEHDGRWEVEIHNLVTGEIVQDWCHILVNACGYLNKPAWPKIPGMQDYGGTCVHSADYDTSISLTNKNVLLIGSGSSAAQILPAIQPRVKSVTIFIRSPSWLLPDISSEAGRFTKDEIERFVREPESVLRLRQDNERTMNSIFSLYLRGSILQEQCRSLLESRMRGILDDREAEESLIPKFEVGCKRVIPSGFKFLKALKKPNVRAVYGGVTSFTSSGVISEDGSIHDGDVVICATGFDTSYVSSFPILGPNCRNLQAEWAESITGYMGVGVSAFPNMFTLLGPYSPVSNGPTLIAIEAQADYICAFVNRYQTEPSIHSMAPKEVACAEFKAHVSSFMAKAVWTANCRNSHNNHEIGGRTPTTWPGSTLHYLEAIREPRWDDWSFTHSTNRFSWLGNGISQTEWDPVADLGYYIRQGDDGAWGSRWRNNAVINKSGSMPPRELHRQTRLAPDSAKTDTMPLQRGDGRDAGH